MKTIEFYGRDEPLLEWHSLIEGMGVMCSPVVPAREPVPGRYAFHVRVTAEQLELLAEVHRSNNSEGTPWNECVGFSFS